jgi:release factor glutamine methyltransferase
VIRSDRTYLLAHGEQTLTDAEWTQYMHFVERRRKHEPVAYITGEQEFYGRKFFVDHRVLIPRPATEGIVRAALKFLDAPFEGEEMVDEGIVVTTKWKMVNGKWKIATLVDVGTGSGCIGITLALERPDMKVIATDISHDALEVAQLNAKRHGVTIDFRQGDGLAPVLDLTEPFLLVSNPPYIPSNRTLMKDVSDFEPHVALFGGSDGMEIAHSLIRAAEEHPFCRGWVMEYGASSC